MTANAFGANFSPQLPDNGFVTWSKLAGEAIPKIEVGGNYELTKGGEALKECFVSSYLPFMSARITNRSNADISVQLGAQKIVTVDIPKKKAVSIVGTPFVSLSIYNRGDVDIEEDEIKITCENDMEQLLLYTQAVRGGLKVAKHHVIQVI